MKETHIQWTDSTFNPWLGCTKVSPGCLNCYAEELMDKRYGKVRWGAGNPRSRTSTSNWNEPKRWNRAAMKAKTAHDEASADAFASINSAYPPWRRPRVFCASLSDWLDAEVPIEWLADLLVLIFDCGFLDWQLLTKRPENFNKRLLLASMFIRNHRDPTERNHAIRGWIDGWVDGKPPHNVWMGTSVEDQLRADIRIPRLLEIPAVVRFLSCEPLLGRVEFSNVTNRVDGVSQLGKPALQGINWVIVGGESGRDARACDPNWIESVIRQAKEVGVSVFVKQLGARIERVGAPGPILVTRHPKGGDPAEWPERFRVAEFPEVAS